MGNVPDKFEWFDVGTADPCGKYKQPIKLGDFERGTKVMGTDGGVNRGPAGGVSSSAMKAVGRNRARARNQGGK